MQIFCYGFKSRFDLRTATSRKYAYTNRDIDIQIQHPVFNLQVFEYSQSLTLYSLQEFGAQDYGVAVVLGISACVASMLGWYYGTLSAITLLAVFILANLAFSLQMLGTPTGSTQALSGVFILYIYGGAIVMLFLLAAVSVPRNHITSTPRPENQNKGRALSVIAWPGTFLFLLPALLTSQNDARRDSLLVGIEGCRGYFMGDSNTPVFLEETSELVKVAGGMVQDPALYVKACALLMLGLVVVINLTTDTKSAQQHPKHTTDWEDPAPYFIIKPKKQLGELTSDKQC